MSVYETATKDSRRIGLEGLAEVCGAAGVPVVAIGGVTAESAGACITAGASGVAVVSAVFAAPDPSEAARQIRAAVDQALHEREQHFNAY